MADPIVNVSSAHAISHIKPKIQIGPFCWTNRRISLINLNLGQLARCGCIWLYWALSFPSTPHVTLPRFTHHNESNICLRCQTASTAWHISYNFYNQKPRAKHLNSKSQVFWTCHDNDPSHWFPIFPNRLSRFLIFLFSEWFARN